MRWTQPAGAVLGGGCGRCMRLPAASLLYFVFLDMEAVGCRCAGLDAGPDLSRGCKRLQRHRQNQHLPALRSAAPAHRHGVGAREERRGGEEGWATGSMRGGHSTQLVSPSVQGKQHTLLYGDGEVEQ